MDAIRKEIIYKFVSKHEVGVSNDMRYEDKHVRFTTFGTIAGCRAVNEILQMLDNDTKVKVIEMMQNKRIS
jgi:hypothetical protein